MYITGPTALPNRIAGLLTFQSEERTWGSESGAADPNLFNSFGASACENDDVVSKRVDPWVELCRTNACMHRLKISFTCCSSSANRQLVMHQSSPATLLPPYLSTDFRKHISQMLTSTVCMSFFVNPCTTPSQATFPP